MSGKSKNHIFAGHFAAVAVMKRQVPCCYHNIILYALCASFNQEHSTSTKWWFLFMFGPSLHQILLQLRGMRHTQNQKQTRCRKWFVNGLYGCCDVSFVCVSNLQWACILWETTPNPCSLYPFLQYPWATPGVPHNTITEGERRVQWQSTEKVQSDSFAQQNKYKEKP